jgi:hypothetical protein
MNLDKLGWPSSPFASMRSTPLSIFARAAFFVLSAFFALFSAEPARAGQGVIEISQVCAISTGCFAGDTPGFPVTIASAGSYRLTSNLVVPDDDTDGIRISTSDVAIDLGGFAVIRSACLDSNTICRPNSGTGSGIETTTTNSRGVSVRHGSVTGVGDFGINLGEQAVVEDVLVRWNGGVGIQVDLGSKVSDVVVFGNGNDGVFTDAGSVVSNGAIYDNSGDGVDAGAGCSLENLTIRSNSGPALRMGAQSAYRNNTMTGNGGGCVIGGSNAGGNSCNGS